MLPAGPSGFKHNHLFHWETLFSQIQEFYTVLWFFFLRRKMVSSFSLILVMMADSELPPDSLWNAKMCSIHERGVKGCVFLLWHEGNKIQTRQQVTLQEELNMRVFVMWLHVCIYSSDEWHFHCFLPQGFSCEQTHFSIHPKWNIKVSLRSNKCSDFIFILEGKQNIF